MIASFVLEVPRLIRIMAVPSPLSFFRTRPRRNESRLYQNVLISNVQFNSSQYFDFNLLDLKLRVREFR